MPDGMVLVIIKEKINQRVITASIFIWQSMVKNQVPGLTARRLYKREENSTIIIIEKSTPILAVMVFTSVISKKGRKVNDIYIRQIPGLF